MVQCFTHFNILIHGKVYHTKIFVPSNLTKIQTLPGNNKNRLFTRSWTARVRFLASWVDLGNRCSSWSLIKSKVQKKWCRARLPGLPIRDCARSCNSSTPRCTKVSAIDMTAKTFFERLYLVLWLVLICALSQLSVCSHTPTVHATTISRFPCKFFPRIQTRQFHSEPVEPVHSIRRSRCYAPSDPAIASYPSGSSEPVFLDTNAVEEGWCNGQRHRAFVSYAMLPSKSGGSSRGLNHK